MVVYFVMFDGTRTLQPTIFVGVWTSKQSEKNHQMMSIMTKEILEVTLKRKIVLEIRKTKWTKSKPKQYVDSQNSSFLNITFTDIFEKTRFVHIKYNTVNVDVAFLGDIGLHPRMNVFTISLYLSTRMQVLYEIALLNVRC